jgi:hypothetical protein
MRPVVILLALLLPGIARADLPATWEYPLSPSKVGITIPTVSDPVLDRKLRKALWYKLPQVYQEYALGELRLKLVDDKPEQNGNRNFPWAGTFGMVGENGTLGETGSINVLWLDKPICVLHSGKPFTCVYPIGTIAGELLFFEQRDPANPNAVRRITFELRIREKIETTDPQGRKIATWEPAVYRPVPDEGEFRRLTNLPAHYAFGQRHIFLRNFQSDEVEKIEGYVQELPDLNQQQVTQLLDRPFVESQWAASGGIFPRKYALGLLDVDAESCSRCHKQTGIHNYRLIPNEPRIDTNYTTIRGFDGIFTWHPFRKEALGDKPDWRLREHDWDKGIVAPAKKPGEYILTHYVRTSLDAHELHPSLTKPQE